MDKHLKEIILIIAIVIIATVIGIAQTVKHPPQPVPPEASYVDCGQAVVSEAEMTAFAAGARLQGCTDITFHYIWDGFWLGRSSRIAVVNP